MFDSDQKNNLLSLGTNSVYIGTGGTVVIDGVERSAAAAIADGFGTLEYSNDGLIITGGFIKV